MESSSSEGASLVHELTRLSTNSTTSQHHHNKRSPSPLLYNEDPKRRRLEDEIMETSSRESRWSCYRDCTNLSTLTEQSDDHTKDLLEGCNGVHVAAHQVPDLEDHIDKLAMELEEWSLVNLKEWRQQQFGNTMDVDGSPSCPKGRSKAAARNKQKAAKRKLMRVLRHHDTTEAMEE